MFPNSFLTSNNDIVIEIGNAYRVYSTIREFKRKKVILINRSDSFYNKLSLKTKNAIVKKFDIKDHAIFEINTNLTEIKNGGRVKIEPVSHQGFLVSFFQNGSNQNAVNNLTSIGDMPVNLYGMVRVDNGITFVIYTDISLSTDILKSLIEEIKPLDTFFLKDNYPFLNSITFISKKFSKNKVVIKDYKDKLLKHFKSSLYNLCENLIQVVLKDKAKNEKVVKFNVSLGSERKSLNILNELVRLEYIKSGFKNLNKVEGYFILKESIFNLLKNNNLDKKVFFEVNGISIFRKKDDIKDILTKLDLSFKSNDFIHFKVYNENLRKSKFFTKYTLVKIQQA